MCLVFFFLQVSKQEWQATHLNRPPPCGFHDNKTIEEKTETKGVWNIHCSAENFYTNKYIFSSQSSSSTKKGLKLRMRVTSSIHRVSHWNKQQPLQVQRPPKLRSSPRGPYFYLGPRVYNNAGLLWAEASFDMLFRPPKTNWFQELSSLPASTELGPIDGF